MKVVLFFIFVAFLFIVFQTYDCQRISDRMRDFRAYRSRRPRIPLIIHQTWKTKDLPDNFARWSATWRTLNPQFKYMFWDDVTLREFVADKYPKYLKMYDAFDCHIKRVDTVRYLILHHYGGLYADMDFECVRPLDMDDIANKESLVLGRMGSDTSFPHSIPNALMISAPGHPFWLDVMDAVAKRSSIKKNVEYCTGPIVLKHVADKWGTDIRVKPPEYFYLNNWSTSLWKSSLEPLWRANPKKFLQMYPRCYALTYWTHTW